MVDREINLILVVDTFLLLLIGIGRQDRAGAVRGGHGEHGRRDEASRHAQDAHDGRIGRVVAGRVRRDSLTQLLHFSTGALAIAGGLISFIISVTMVLSPGDAETQHRQMEGKDPMQLAVFPLAVPYLLNPVGIIVLVTLSAEAGSIGHVGIVIGLLALVLVLDIVVFRWANRVSEHLDESRMLLTEKVFGFLIAAIAVQFVLAGLADLGVIHLTAH